MAGRYSNIALVPVFEKSETPVYHAPQTGIFRIIPTSLVPYAELMRLDRPAGYYAFYWHYAIGIAFAASIAPELQSLADVGALTVYFAVWVVIFRGAVCAWNDNIDQDFDRQVARCRFRPIARGAVTTFQGHVFTAIQVILGAVMLAPLPWTVLAYAGVMTVILGIYPFGKRFTDFPQVILGFAFAIPVFMCSAALDADPLLELYDSGKIQATRPLWGAACLYGANTLWTIIFDTIYAHQDIKDDRKAGVKSLAVRLGDKTKLGLGILGAIQISLLLATGYFCRLDMLYFLVGCGGAAWALVSMLIMVDLEMPASCAWWFGPGSRLLGLSVVLGFLCHYAVRLLQAS